MKMENLKALFLISVLILFSTACDDDDDNDPTPVPTPITESQSPPDGEQEMNLNQVLSGDERFSIFTQAMEDAGLMQMLEAREYTIFAPTNEAFQQLPENELQEFLADRERLRSFLLYHIVPGRYSSEKISTEDDLDAANDSDIDVQVSAEGEILVNNVPIVHPDMQASNGLIHGINDFLKQPEGTTATGEEVDAGIFDLLQDNGNYSIFIEIAQLAGFEQALNENGPFTIFVPSNAAFEKLKPELLEQMRNDADAAGSVIEVHTVANRYMQEDIANVETLRTLAMAKIEVSKDDNGNVLVNKIPLAEANIPAKNGVIHFIDSVLFFGTADSSGSPDTQPPGDGDSDDANILEIIQNNNDFSILVGLLEQSELRQLLQGDEDYTLFAPTNAAFEELGENVYQLLTSSPEILEEVLRYHIVNDSQDGEDLLESGEMKTLQGENLKFKKGDDGSILVNGHAIHSLDVEADNGYIHVIDRLLLPLALR